MERSEDGLRELEQHCAHQLQHGLDALGANLEHLIENGVAVEAMARQNADAQLAASAASQYDTLEGLSLEGRSAAASSLEEVRTSSEVGACVERLLRGLEEDERRREAHGSGEAATAATEGLLAAQADLEARVGGAEGMLQKFGTDAIEAEAEHESKQDAALSELRRRQGTLEQGVASFMDELRTEMLAGEEGARVDLAAERDERLASGTEALVAAAELQAWAEAAVAQQATELEAAVLGSVAEGLVASAATESARYDAEARQSALAAEVAAQREALEAAFAEEKRKSWEQVSEQGAALMGELAEEAEARAKGEAELREMMSTRCGALEEAASSARVETEAAVQQALSEVVVEATVERLRAATAGDGEALRVTGELSALGGRCGAVEAELQAQAAQLAARVDEQQRQVYP